jgi:hypothetical protein
MAVDWLIKRLPAIFPGRGLLCAPRQSDLGGQEGPGRPKLARSSVRVTPAVRFRTYDQAVSSRFALTPLTKRALRHTVHRAGGRAARVPIGPEVSVPLGQRGLVDAGLAYRRTPGAYNFGLPLFAG